MRWIVGATVALLVSASPVHGQDTDAEIQAIIDAVNAAKNSWLIRERNAQYSIIRNQCLALEQLLANMHSAYQDLPVSPTGYPNWSLPPVVDRGDGNGPTIISCPALVPLEG